jgi:hypothetical protein
MLWIASGRYIQVYKYWAEAVGSESGTCGAHINPAGVGGGLLLFSVGQLEPREANATRCALVPSTPRKGALLLWAVTKRSTRPRR